jgi:hypothetical protein
MLQRYLTSGTIAAIFFQKSGKRRAWTAGTMPALHIEKVTHRVIFLTVVRTFQKIRFWRVTFLAQPR